MATVRDRGQLVLIAGLALAISLVAIALVLNSAIYTHNLASRYDSPGDGVVRSNHDIRESAGANVRYVNEEYADGGYSTVLTNYEDGIPDIEAAVAEDAAIHGRLLRVTHVSNSDVEGVRIVDDEDGGSDFTSRTGAADWTVVKDAQVRAFTVRADAATTSPFQVGTVESGLVSSGAFTVGFDDDSDGNDEWQVAIYENDDTGDDDISVTVENPDGSVQTCTSASSEVELSLSTGRIGSEACSGLLFVEELSKPYDINFSNAGAIDGSYRLVADGVVGGPDVTTGAFTDRVDAMNYGAHCGDADAGTEQSTFYSADAASGEYPRVTPALYEAMIDTTYDSDSITYEGRHRIAPGETGERPQTPVITSFSVGEADTTNSSDGNYTVSWTVIDPNNNLDTVKVEAFDNGTLVADTTIDGDTLDLETNRRYTFRVTAQDTDGNTRTASQVHREDGGESGCPA